MGDNLYTTYWQSVLPNLIEQFKAGKQIVQQEIKELVKYGDRQSYYANFRINKGQIEIPRNAYAQGRDLFAVLSQDDYFKDNLSNVTLQITIGKDLQLKIEILAADAPDFFTEEDFTELARFTKETMDNENEEHRQTYDYLKNTYNKIEYWAKQVNQKLFPQGTVQVRKRPTNQASRFEYYQWAKIYPDKVTTEFKILAFTVGIDTDNHFQIKIDTVGLGEDDERRQKYFQVRGDYHNSKIVKLLPSEQVLDKGWQYLIDLSANLITDLKPSFDSLLQVLQGTNSVVTIETNKKEIAMDLNTILYGPPGTGKTYNSINKALEITGDTIIGRSRKEIKNIFDKRLEERRIVFTTFHQSMSYEDFIEGIKPLNPQPGEPLKYDVVKGLFKELCEIARSNFENSRKENQEMLPFEEAFEKLKDEWEADPSMNFPLKTSGYEFTIIGFTNTSIQFRKASGGTGHTLSINTLKEQYYGKQHNFKQGVSIYYPGILSKLRSYKGDTAQKADQLNYVLIIDEINRGNVSQIFGELITLIEEDKRLGMPEALSATLPYSKEPFTVPPNLYIVGTMNTADRSVEALDTALRRRFTFESMLPDVSKITESPAGVDIPEMLSVVNKRLEALLTKDHTIGHAWLMKIDTLKKLQAAFKNKIIPLLQEFFYNDYAKIGLVLGKKFVEAIPVGQKMFAAFDDGNELASEYADKIIYTLKDPFELKLEDFISIYE